MTIKQVFLKSLYPVFNAFAKAAGKNNKVYKSTNMASQSFYDLSTELNNGTTLYFSDLKNKKVMLVNTASDCGYTRQYEGLQALQEKYQNDLVIIGFPANDFGEQEKGSDDAIASFCKVNFGVTFPLAKKATVVKQPGQHEVYKWLTTEAANGWNDMAPSWNFCKYLVDEEGNLTHFFEAGIEPTGKEITKAIEEQPGK
ncbi:MAG: glutathione peroxidase [Chitinophagaceae bacterium]|nr:MAG: glutathione peroxidase [Chitinophagaceae bacterium]